MIVVSHRLTRRQQVALPEIDVDALVRLGRLAPQLARVEAHAVERLRLLAQAVGVGVGEDVDAVERVDHAALARARSAAAACGRRVDVARHAPRSPAREARRRRRSRGRTSCAIRRWRARAPASGPAPRRSRGASGRSLEERRSARPARRRRRRPSRRAARVDAVEPVLVVASRAGSGPGPCARCRGGTRRCCSRPRAPPARIDREHRRLPRRVEDGSFSSRSTGPKPCMPPRSCTPSMPRFYRLGSGLTIRQSISGFPISEFEGAWGRPAGARRERPRDGRAGPSRGGGGTSRACPRSGPGQGRSTGSAGRRSASARRARSTNAGPTRWADRARSRLWKNAARRQRRHSASAGGVGRPGEPRCGPMQRWKCQDSLPWTCTVA